MCLTIATYAHGSDTDANWRLSMIMVTFQYLQLQVLNNANIFVNRPKAGHIGRVHTRNFTRRANLSRTVARVHSASTASGSSGTLRPHQEVFAVDANGSRRVGAAV